MIFDLVDDQARLLVAAVDEDDGGGMGSMMMVVMMIDGGLVTVICTKIITITQKLLFDGENHGIICSYRNWYK